MRIKPKYCQLSVWSVVITHFPGHSQNHTAMSLLHSCSFPSLSNNITTECALDLCRRLDRECLFFPQFHLLEIRQPNTRAYLTGLLSISCWSLAALPNPHTNTHTNTTVVSVHIKFYKTRKTVKRYKILYFDINQDLMVVQWHVLVVMMMMMMMVPIHVWGFHIYFGNAINLCYNTSHTAHSIEIESKVNAKQKLTHTNQM